MVSAMCWPKQGSIFAAVENYIWRIDPTTEKKKTEKVVDLKEHQHTISQILSDEKHGRFISISDDKMLIWEAASPHFLLYVIPSEKPIIDVRLVKKD